MKTRKMFGIRVPDKMKTSKMFGIRVPNKMKTRNTRNTMASAILQ